MGLKRLNLMLSIYPDKASPMQYLLKLPGRKRKSFATAKKGELRSTLACFNSNIAKSFCASGSRHAGKG